MSVLFCLLLFFGSKSLSNFIIRIDAFHRYRWKQSLVMPTVTRCLYEVCYPMHPWYGTCIITYTYRVAFYVQIESTLHRGFFLMHTSFSVREPSSHNWHHGFPHSFSSIYPYKYTMCILIWFLYFCYCTAVSTHSLSGVYELSMNSELFMPHLKTYRSEMG